MGGTPPSLPPIITSSCRGRSLVAFSPTAGKRDQLRRCAGRDRICGSCQKNGMGSRNEASFHSVISAPRGLRGERLAIHHSFVLIQDRRSLSISHKEGRFLSSS